MRIEKNNKIFNLLIFIVIILFLILISLISFKQTSSNYNIVILSGRVIDPEKNYDEIANIGINGNKISIITKGVIKGLKTINATGLIVSPGFIDVGISGQPSFETYKNIEFWKITDGVTTALYMHDGTGSIENYEKLFLNNVHYTNYGFSTKVSEYLLYNLSKQLDLIQNNILNGALGVSVSPEYNPEIKTNDLLEYAKVAKKNNLPLLSHLRFSSKDKELDGVREAVYISQQTGVKFHIFHLPSTGGTFNMSEALKLIEFARVQGIEIDADLYPYSYWATYINSERFNSGWQERYNLTYEQLYYLTNSIFLNESLFKGYRKVGGLIIVPENTLSWNNSIYPALQSDFVFIASDGSYDLLVNSSAHPRKTGTFATAVATSKKINMSLLNIIKKLTLDPANLMKYSEESFIDRGRLQKGAFADITIFDYNTMDGSGTIQYPAQTSKGIRYVIVNGKTVYEDGKINEVNAGEFLKHKKKINNFNLYLKKLFS